jgi:hypothetical protein
MKDLALRFPGSILVFATMKQSNQLSDGEKKRISQLALWGREYLKEMRQTRAPVILLTGTELFARHDLHEAWEKTGGRHADFARVGMLCHENLSTLADLTQQLYLDLPPYSTWLEAKMNRLRARRQQRAAPIPVQAADPPAANLEV